MARINQLTFRSLFVAGPLLICSLLPSLFFGLTFGQWGSNLLWGSVFGAGWCLAGFATGSLTNATATTVGALIWPAVVLGLLYVLSGVIWRRTAAPRRQTIALVLALTFLLDAPANAVMALERSGHFPDFSYHMATSW